MLPSLRERSQRQTLTQIIPLLTSRYDPEQETAEANALLCVGGGGSALPPSEHPAPGAPLGPRGLLASVTTSRLHSRHQTWCLPSEEDFLEVPSTNFFYFNLVAGPHVIIREGGRWRALVHCRSE